jgi:hypothetical protein
MRRGLNFELTTTKMQYEAKMHTDKKLLCNRFFLNQQLEGDKKKERDRADREVFII